MTQDETPFMLEPGLFAEKRLGLTPDAKQAELLRGNLKRVLLNCSRQWGKSTITAALAVHRAVYEEDSLTVVLSPTLRQSGEFLRKAAAFMRKLGMRVRGDGDNAVSLLLPNQSRIVGLPGTEATVRGFSKVSLMVIDEASRVPDDLFNAVRPMLAVGDGDMLVMSTPFGQRGFFWEQWTQNARMWERISVPATECPRISARFLEDERTMMGDRWFRQEYLCEFVDVNDSLFDRELLESAIDYSVAPLVFPSRRW
jgi:hypothetical protein